MPNQAIEIPACWQDLGLRDYQETLELQRALCEKRQQGFIEDTLLLVEHPDVITLGRKASSQQNVLETSIPVVEIERGGDVTYHGPGQLVGYPILLLREPERDLHAYLRLLEQALIEVCAAVGVQGERRPNFTGVWIGDRKVASIGIAVRRWVTLHGFALNVATDLSCFSAIHPCGLDASVMTSLSEAAGRSITVEQIKPQMVAALGSALHRHFGFHS